MGVEPLAALAVDLFLDEGKRFGRPGDLADLVVRDLVHRRLGQLVGCVDTHPSWRGVRLNERVPSAPALEVVGDNEDEKVVELCERFFETYTHRRRNPAAELVRLNDGEVFTPDQYRAFEKAQVDSAGDILSIICDYT